MDLSQLHFTLGLYVRNQFGLWGNATLRASCGRDHPDACSGVILERARALLQR